MMISVERTSNNQREPGQERMVESPLLSHSFAYSFGCVGISFKFFICTLHFRSARLALKGQLEIGNENAIRSVANLRLAFHNFLATNEVFRYVSF